MITDRLTRRCALLLSMVPFCVATVLASPAAAGLQPGGSFLDDDGSVHEGAIEAIAAEGISLGCLPEYFCTDRLLTRAEMAAFLSRALELPTGAPDLFADDAAHMFEEEINAIAAAGITRGCTDADFCPDDTMSRGQMASFLVRAFNVSAATNDVFLDDDGSVHEAAINALAASGITAGCDLRQFCPLQRVARDQMASFLARALGLDPIVPPLRAPQLCRTASATSPSRTFAGASGEHGALPGPGDLWTYRVEVEHGIGFDADCFAASVEMVLTDPDNGWGSAGRRSFQRVADGPVDFIVALASPSTTDALCLPLNTGGIYSCWNGARAVVNSWRWETGAAAYDDVEQYRIYLINHEVGHALGFGHRSCTGTDDPAPVMMQQSKGVGSCVADPWPEDFEM